MTNQFKLALLQLSGMVRYEFRRNWRRKGLPMMMLVWLVAVVSGTTLFTGPTFFQPSPELVAGSALIRKVSITLDIMIAGGGISAVFATFTLSIVAAEIIPIDRQLGVMEWFDTLPLGPALYLTGKLLGIWTAVFSGILGIGTLSGIAFWVLIGPYDLIAYGRLWLVALTAIALYMSGLSLLLTSWLHSRRWALFIGLGVAIVGYIYSLPGFLQFFATIYTDFFVKYVATMRAEACQIDPESCGQPLLTPQLFPEFMEINQRLWQLAILFGITAVLAWGWQKWREHK